MEMTITLHRDDYMVLVDGIADVIGELEDRKDQPAPFHTDDWMIHKLCEVFVTIFQGQAWTKIKTLDGTTS